MYKIVAGNDFSNFVKVEFVKEEYRQELSIVFNKDCETIIPEMHNIFCSEE